MHLPDDDHDRSPSGVQWPIAHAEQRAVVVEVGGGLRSYTVAGRDVVDGYPQDQMCSASRGQVLIPWPNRIQDGRYRFAGREHQLALNEPQRSNAIHGLVCWQRWSVVRRQPDHVTVAAELFPQPGYPFHLEVTITYRLSAAGLRVTTTARNAGREPCPFGSGAHPYLDPGVARVDDAVLHAPAGTVLLSHPRGIPIDRKPVDGTEYDFRQPRLLGATRLDHCFADLERDAEGIARVHLGPPTGGTGVTVWMDASHTHVMLFTGDPLPEVDRRSLAVEPMTCPPDAFRSGQGLITLEPAESWIGEWGIAPDTSSD